MNKVSDSYTRLKIVYFSREFCINLHCLSYDVFNGCEPRNRTWSQSAYETDVTPCELAVILGGPSRDRTDDLRLAKPPLSQLSYSPLSCRATKKTWWVWLGSNQRPPPYQDGALTS